MPKSLIETGLEPASEPPKSWTKAAKTAFAEVLAARPELQGAERAQLEIAGELISRADRLDRQIRRDGYVSTGSMGQPVANPLLAESSKCRTAAATILDRLTAPVRGITQRQARQRRGLNRGTN
jgi:hypothetical protein